jgi:hypothetical protein
MPNTPVSKIVTSSIGRGAELQYGPGNNQYARASDVNPIINALNNFSLANASVNAVTQLTSTTTGVTLNAITGVITMFGSTITAGSSASFVLTNSNITSNSLIFAITSGGANNSAQLVSAQPASGSATFTVSVPTGATATGTTPVKVFFTIL